MKIKQIYSFEHYNPPALTEAMLRRKSEQRKSKQQTVTLALCGVAFIFCLIAKAIMLYPVSEALSIAIIAYASVSFLGAVVIALIFAKMHRMQIIAQ